MKISSRNVVEGTARAPHRAMYKAMGLTNEDYSLKFYVNQQLVKDLREYVVQEDDRILITYGNEDQLAIDKQLAELNAQAINRL